MRNTGLTLIAVGLAAVPTPLLSAPKNDTIKVTATVYDCSGTCNGTNQLLLRSDDYNGLGYATYVTTSNRGTANVQNYISADEGWNLFLGSQSARTLYLTPNQPIGSQPSGPPAGYYWQDVKAYSNCRDQNDNIVPFTSLVNGSNSCSMAVNFNYNGALHKLIMSPHLPGPGPATGVASVACNAVSDGKCIDWTIAPNSAAPNVNVSNLYYYSSARGTATWVFVGQYYNSFLIRVTNP